MMFTASTLRLCMELAERVGKVTSAHMYNENFIAVEGTTNDGKAFSITMNAKEEQSNGD